jgi:serine/threonine-protein kinase
MDNDSATGSVSLPFDRNTSSPSSNSGLTDPRLATAVRMEFNGISVPSLGGIPLLSKLGEGGMGAVYLGFHPRLTTNVAVKILPADRAYQKPELEQRFIREAQLAARIKSPRLVTVLDVNRDCGLNYIIMEYVDGSTARSLTQSTSSTGIGIEERLALDICIAAAEGLSAAHAQNIIHRDIKPDNILVPRDLGGSGYDYSASKLADLGLARPCDSDQSLTGSHSAVGTPGYMAPEQAAANKVIDKRADVFGLGATLYYLLAGKSPFKGETPLQIMMATVNESPTPIHAIRANVSPATAALVEHCLMKDPRQRYADGPALLSALRICHGSLGKPGTDQRDAMKQLNLIREKPETTFYAAVETDSVSHANISNATVIPPARLARKFGWIAAAIAIPVLILPTSFWARRRSSATNAEKQSEFASPTAQTPIEQIVPMPPPVTPTLPAVAVDPANSEFTKTMSQVDDLLLGESVDSVGAFSSLSDDKRLKIYAAMSQAMGLKPDDPKLLALRTKLKPPANNSLKLDKENSIEFTLVPAGTFKMGSVEGSSDEQPVHSVQIARALYLSKFPITRRQFKLFVGATSYRTDAERGNKAWVLSDGGWTLSTDVNWKSPGFPQDEDHPVVLVSWNDAQAFVDWFSQSTKRTAHLPTEAEWEYAARGPQNLKYPWGQQWEAVKANHADAALGNSGALGASHHFTNANDGCAFTSPVGKFPNSSWCGCFDMAGNVWQWCGDNYSSDYSTKPPAESAHSPLKVTRGGSWSDLPVNCRSSERHSAAAVNSYTCVGFRVAFVAPPDPP